MSGVYVDECCRFLYNSTTTKTVTVPMLTNVGIGDYVVLAVNCPAGGGANTLYDVSDSNGNDWDFQGISVTAAPGNSQLGLATYKATAALDTSDTLSVSVNNSGAVSWAVNALHFSGIDDTDVATVAATATGSSLNSGTTTVPSQPSQLIVGAFGYTGSGVVVSGLTPVGMTARPVLTMTSLVRNMQMFYGFVNSATARTITASMDASHAWSGGIVAANVSLPQSITFGKTVTIG